MAGTDSLYVETTFADTISGVASIDRCLSGIRIDSIDSSTNTHSGNQLRISVNMEGVSRTSLVDRANGGATFQNWSIGLMIIILALLASIRVAKEKYLTQLMQSSVNMRAANRLYRERAINVFHVAFRLDFIFYTVFGLFLFLIIEQQNQSHTDSEFQLFLFCSIGIMAYYLIKQMLYLVSGTIFDAEEEVTEFVFYQKLGNRLIGLFLMPISLLLYLMKGDEDWILIWIGIVIVLVFSVISLFRGVRIVAKKNISTYYLFLYLCTLEILPLVLVWRILWRV